MLEAPFIDAGDDFVINDEDKFYMNASGDGIALWRPSDGLLDSTSFTSEIIPTNSRLYNLYVTGNNGCISYDSVFITLRNCSCV